MIPFADSGIGQPAADGATRRCAMADFTNGFWNIWIIVLTVLGIIGCGVLLWQQSNWKVKKGSRRRHHRPRLGRRPDRTEHPLPRWWMWLFYITIVFGRLPGRLSGPGHLPGKLGWKSTGEYEADVKAAEAEYGPLFDSYMKQDLKAWPPIRRPMPSANACS
jgi:cytochrome c oxidase cbb3-type subunit 3